MKRYVLSKRQFSAAPQDLFSAILNLQTIGEAEQFLLDLLTEEEVGEFARRWKAAELLYEGVPYSDIVAMTGLSSTTIARVSKFLKEGNGGYRLMLDRLHRNRLNPSYP